MTNQRQHPKPSKVQDDADADAASIASTTPSTSNNSSTAQQDADDLLDLSLAPPPTATRCQSDGVVIHYRKNRMRRRLGLKKTASESRLLLKELLEHCDVDDKLNQQQKQQPSRPWAVGWLKNHKGGAGNSNHNNSSRSCCDLPLSSASEHNEEGHVQNGSIAMLRQMYFKQQKERGEEHIYESPSGKGNSKRRLAICGGASPLDATLTSFLLDGL